VTVGELLLELAGEALLRLVPALEKGNRDEDDNRLPAVANLDLKNPGVSVLKLPSALRLFDV